MDSEKVSFVRAENGIVVEIQDKNWDGHTIRRKIFEYSDDILDEEILSAAINFAFNGRVGAKSLMKLPQPVPTF